MCASASLRLQAHKTRSTCTPRPVLTVDDNSDISTVARALRVDSAAHIDPAVRAGQLVDRQAGEEDGGACVLVRVIDDVHHL